MILPSATDRPIVVFKVWPSLAYRTRLLAALVLIGAGLVVQFFSASFVWGAPLLALGTLFTLVNAETLSVTSENVEQLRADPTPEISMLLGLDGIKGKGMGLPDEWGYQVIKQVGNYGQSFERNVGQGSALKMNRGLNSLWSHGGVLFGPPAR